MGESVRGRILGTEWAQGWHVCVLIDATVCVCAYVCVCVCVHVHVCLCGRVHVCVWVHVDVHFKRSVFLGI